MKKHIIAAAILGAFSMPSLASNFFVFGDVGKSRFEVDSESETKTGYSLGGGYQFNRIFALELAYRNLGEWDESFNGLRVGNRTYRGRIDLKASAVQLSATAALPLSESFNLYGRAGIAQLKVEADVTARSGSVSVSESDSETKSKALVGVGLSYDINSSFSVRGEYTQYAEIEDLTLSTLNVGVLYRF